MAATLHLPLQSGRSGALTELRAESGKRSWLAFTREWVISTDDRGDAERFLAAIGGNTIAPPLAQMLARCDRHAALCGAMARDLTTRLLGVPSLGVLVAMAEPAEPGAPPIARLTAYFDSPALAQRAVAAVRAAAKDPKRSEGLRRVAGLLAPEIRFDPRRRHRSGHRRPRLGDGQGAASRNPWHAALEGKRLRAVIGGVPPVPPSKRVHPTEKPVDLMTMLIEKSCPPGGLVVDPFCGSGPVLEAAQRLGRRAIGIEIEERYCAAAAARLDSQPMSAEASHKASRSDSEGRKRTALPGARRLRGIDAAR